MEACPRCGESAAVEFDLVQGVSACVACGAVLEEEELVHGDAFDQGGARLGTLVASGDTGERAAAYALPESGAGLAIQRSRRSGGEGKVKERVREFAARLSLQPAVVQQAQHLVSQAAPHLLGSWRHDMLAAAVTYAACRLDSLPLTLADLSGATQLPPWTLGRHYCAVCRLLDLRPPLLLAPHLLPRCLDKLTSQAVQTRELSAVQVAALRRDAGAMLDWMAVQMRRQAHPLAAVATALVLAAEMNTISLSQVHVCTTLQLPKCTLARVLGEARRRLVELAAFLPYAASVNTKNVGSHARTIVQLAGLVGVVGSAGSREDPQARGAPQRLVCGPQAGAAALEERREQPAAADQGTGGGRNGLGLGPVTGQQGVQQGPARTAEQQAVPRQQGGAAGMPQQQPQQKQQQQQQQQQLCEPGTELALRPRSANSLEPRQCKRLRVEHSPGLGAPGRHSDQQGAAGGAGSQPG